MNSGQVGAALDGFANFVGLLALFLAIRAYRIAKGKDAATRELVIAQGRKQFELLLLRDLMTVMEADRGNPLAMSQKGRSILSLLSDAEMSRWRRFSQRARNWSPGQENSEELLTEAEEAILLKEVRLAIYRRTSAN